MAIDAPRTPPTLPLDGDAAMTAIKKYESLLHTVTRTPRPPSPSKSPSKQLFLTKDTSTLTMFTAWDVDERLHELDSQFRTIKDAMDSTLSDRKGLEEALDLAKMRGK